MTQYVAGFEPTTYRVKANALATRSKDSIVGVGVGPGMKFSGYKVTFYIAIYFSATYPRNRKKGSKNRTHNVGTRD